MRRLHLYLALRQKTCTLRTAGQVSGVASHVSPRPCLPRPRSAPTVPEDASALEEDTRLRDRHPAARVASSAIPCATRRAPTCSTWSSASGQTSIRFHRDEDRLAAARARNRSSTACRSPRPCGSSAPSAISPTSPTSPKTTTTSARCGARSRRAASGPRWRCRMRARPGSARPICAASSRTRSVSPVLTAHPTEVRRKSTMDREMEIAALLDRRERVQMTPDEIVASRRAVAPRGIDVVADQSAAPYQAHRARRSRQRAFVLRLHLPARGAAAALRAGRSSQRGGRRGRGGRLPS